MGVKREAEREVRRMSKRAGGWVDVRKTALSISELLDERAVSGRMRQQPHQVDCGLAGERLSWRSRLVGELQVSRP